MENKQKFVTKWLLHALKGRIVFVRYFDILLAKNVRQREIRPIERETVGWLEKVDFDGDFPFVLIRWDRSQELPQERDRISGISIPLFLISEIREVFY